MDYYLSILDPFVLYTNLIHNCFPEPVACHNITASATDYINLCNDLEGLVVTLSDAQD